MDDLSAMVEAVMATGEIANQIHRVWEARHMVEFGDEIPKAIGVGLGETQVNLLRPAINAYAKTFGPEPDFTQYYGIPLICLPLYSFFGIVYDYADRVTRAP